MNSMKLQPQCFILFEKTAKNTDLGGAANFYTGLMINTKYEE